MQTVHIYTLLAITFVIESFAAKINNTASHEHTSKSQITVASEGGAIVSNSSTAQLNFNSNSYINLLQLEDDFSKSNKSSIVARKKAEYLEDITTPLINKNMANDTSDFVKANVTTNKIALPRKGNATNLENITPKTNHKPLILSYELLTQTDEKIKVFISENGSNLKVHELNSNSHPGMVMPIVITILVVPMFAVVGYMALRRGREAWKNRHYKRMDFLLDGMYNE